MCMMRVRGFSMLEVMLALVVVAIGISVLLAFSSSSHRETASKATGNDYSVIINQVLNQFTTSNADCMAGKTSGCDLLNNTNAQLAGDYLNRSASIPQKDAINATGITVSIKSCVSDTGCSSV